MKLSSGPSTDYWEINKKFGLGHLPSILIATVLSHAQSMFDVTCPGDDVAHALTFPVPAELGMQWLIL